MCLLPLDDSWQSTGVCACVWYTWQWADRVNIKIHTNIHITSEFITHAFQYR